VSSQSAHPLAFDREIAHGEIAPGAQDFAGFHVCKEEAHCAVDFRLRDFPLREVDFRFIESRRVRLCAKVT